MEFELEVEKVLDELRRNMQARQSVARTESTATPGLHLVSQLESHLTVTERAWSRLPPLLSNRRGWKSRVELWCKRQIKRATWWFVWEQINFNAAANDALHLMMTALAEHKRQEAELRAQLDDLKATVQALQVGRMRAPEPVGTLMRAPESIGTRTDAKRKVEPAG